MHAHGNINIYTYSIKRGCIQDTSFWSESGLKFSFQSHSDYTMAFCSSSAILNWWLNIFTNVLFNVFFQYYFQDIDRKQILAQIPSLILLLSPTLASYKQQEWCRKAILMVLESLSEQYLFQLRTKMQHVNFSVVFFSGLLNLSKYIRYMRYVYIWYLLSVLVTVLY